MSSLVFGLPDWWDTGPTTFQFELWIGGFAQAITEVAGGVSELVWFLENLLVPTILYWAETVLTGGVDDIVELAVALQEAAEAQALLNIEVMAATTAEVAVATEAFNGTWSKVVNATRVAWHEQTAIASQIFHTVASKAVVIWKTFKKLLEAIHFKTIMKVHQILSLLWPAYRRMMKTVYNRIARISEAVGLGAHFINLALRNSRNLVLDASTLMGRTYDVAQVAWMTDLNAFLPVIQRNAHKYENDPEEFFNDLDNWIDKPTQDVKGEFAVSFLLTLQNASETAGQWADGFHKIGIDIETLVNDLPEYIQKHIPDVVLDITGPITKYIQDNVTPTIDLLDGAIELLQEEKEGIQLSMDGVIERLKKPGTLLKGVDDLEYWERLDEEETIAEVAGRTMIRAEGYIAQALAPVSEEFKRIAAAAILVYQPPAWHIPEVPLGTKLAITPGTPHTGWFVGDY